MKGGFAMPTASGIGMPSNADTGSSARKEEDKGQGYKLSSANFYSSQSLGPLDRMRLGGDSNINEAKKHTIVCTHWLRGLCKKGENCEFLHSYDPNKMPIWKYYQNGNCKNENWQYLHQDARIKRSECPYYEKGFCK